MSRYLDRLHDLEVSRRIALQHQISRSTYQQLLEREQINNLQRKLDVERNIEIDRQMALEAEALRRRELEFRLAEQRELDLQRSITQKARLEDARIRALEVEIQGLRSRVEAERLQQNQLNNDVGSLSIEIAELYRISDERERTDLLELEKLDEQIQKLQMTMRDSQYKRNAYQNSIEDMSKLLI